MANRKSTWSQELFLRAIIFNLYYACLLLDTDLQTRNTRLGPHAFRRVHFRGWSREFVRCLAGLRGMLGIVKNGSQRSPLIIW